MTYIKDNALYFEGNDKIIEVKELKDKIKGLQLLGLEVINISINFELMDIEEYKEGTKNGKNALMLFNKSKWKNLDITNIRGKKVELEGMLYITLNQQLINYICIEFDNK